MTTVLLYDQMEANSHKISYIYPQTTVRGPMDPGQHLDSCKSETGTLSEIKTYLACLLQTECNIMQ